MARHSLSEPEMQHLADRLVDLVLYTGSVRAAHREIEQALRESGEEGIVYPNRLHTILSADPSRGINTSTVELLQRALTRLDIPTSGGERDRVRSEILNGFGALGATSLSDFRSVVDQCGFPAAVVLQVARSTHSLNSSVDSHREGQEIANKATATDWSFQDIAVKSSLESLRKGTNRKVGVIVPTGGGKTRIAMRISLACLNEDPREDSIVLWVTHRLRLKRQARRELQRLLATESSQISKNPTYLFEKRFIFVMVSELEKALEDYRSRLSLVVVDEAHHAAAPSYTSLFDISPIKGLFLTATPNRADRLPIGIDEIAFAITYRELISCGAVVPPTFDSPLEIEELDWASGTGLEDLADYLLDKTDAELNKLLVAVSRKYYAERLYRALQEQLDSRPGHALSEDDICFAHASGTSTDTNPEELLDEFVARPRGIMIATGQLIGEGFDDPGIDGVVITYPSESISHLMQVAGRALRVAPEKKTAHIVQVHASRMHYYFEQRWLYQDISDRLRPQLLDYPYETKSILREIILKLLIEHNVSSAVTDRIHQELEQLKAGGRYSLLFTGLPYYGNNFSSEGQWGAIFISPEHQPRFVRTFNECSDRGIDVNDPQLFLTAHLTPDPTQGSLWKSYADMLSAMEYALKEMRYSPYEGDYNRGYLPRRGSSWLKYVTFDHRPILSSSLTAFLDDAVNRDEISANYVAAPDRWNQVVKLPLPLAGAMAFLLDQTQCHWLEEQRRHLLDRLKFAAPSEGFTEIQSWRVQLCSSPLPLLLIEHIDYLLSETRFRVYSLSLPRETP